jgi:segregation and condensation protein A
MNYEIKIDEFVGPLDLLLHLAKKQEVKMEDISVKLVIEQYLSYIRNLENLHLEVASEYLEMAAELIFVKSKLLLPKKVEVEDSVYEEDPRESIIKRLIEYKKFKEASEELSDLNEGRQLLYTRPPSDLEEFITDEPLQLEDGVEVYDLMLAFQKMMQRKKLQKPLQTRISKREVSVEDRIDNIKTMLDYKEGEVFFDELFDVVDRDYVIATFLAILELAKIHYISIKQESNFERILLEKREGVAHE